MQNLHFSVDIKAPKEMVWEIMLADATYREWTTPFHEGSYFEGSWDEGSAIRFLASDGGKLSGMTSRIAKNIPYEYISIEHLGVVVDGVDDTTSESVQEWVGTHENYRFQEKDGVTTVEIELESVGMSDEFAEMFEGMWPKRSKS
jgi:hypothetical protein